MNIGLLIKDVVTLNRKSLLVRYHRLKCLLQRTFLASDKYTGDPKSIPIIINNFNRYKYLLQLIGWLNKSGYKNIHILDNKSTYGPLLDFYEQTDIPVYYLDDNKGHLALWKDKVFLKFRNDYFVYTDADLVPIDECPSDFILHFRAILDKYRSIEKVGFGLKIDDLPEHYGKRGEVLLWEKKFWEKEVEADVYDAAVDTTFALYRPYTNGFRYVPPAFRTGGKYVVRHLPWYENTSSPDEEERFYASHVKKGASHWIPDKVL